MVERLFLDVAERLCAFAVRWETFLDFGIGGVVAPFGEDEAWYVRGDGGINVRPLSVKGAGGLRAQNNVWLDNLEQLGEEFGGRADFVDLDTVVRLQCRLRVRRLMDFEAVAVAQTVDDAVC